MNNDLIDNGAIAAVARFAGATVLAVALLSSVPAFAGKFSEYDASGVVFQAHIKYGAATAQSAGTSSKGADVQVAEAETVMTDATIGSPSIARDRSYWLARELSVGGNLLSGGR